MASSHTTALWELATASLAARNAASAGYVADALCTLSGGAPSDVLLLAEAHYAAGEYRRAVHALQRHRLYDAGEGGPPPAADVGRGGRPPLAADDVELRARVLAAQCLEKSGLAERCVAVLEPYLAHAGGGHEDPDAWRWVPAPARLSLGAAGCCALGRCYERLDNRPRAALWLTRALALDVGCSEAVEALAKHHLLTEAEAVALVATLRAALAAAGAEWLAELYAGRLCTFSTPTPVDARFAALDALCAAPPAPPSSAGAPAAPPALPSLAKSVGVLVAKAQCAYCMHDTRRAHALAAEARELDPHETGALPVLVASLSALGKKNDLFYLAHQLVDAAPKAAVSWYAIGCYYALVGKNDAAQRHFHKAAKFDPRFAPAWIGFGNAYAAQDESEQAMAAYRTAARLFPGSHLPPLYMGMEYLRTNNVPLARHFLTGARTSCPSDPSVYNELGVAAFREGHYREAAHVFEKVRELCRNLPAAQHAAHETALYNLGQCCRKLGDYDAASGHFRAVLAVAPNSAPAHAALAFCRQLAGDLDGAIEGYHLALGKEPQDTFASEMLSRALVEWAEQGVAVLPEAPVRAAGKAEAGRAGPGGGAGAGASASSAGGESDMSMGESSTDGAGERSDDFSL